jgi:hypothetical protein
MRNTPPRQPIPRGSTAGGARLTCGWANVGWFLCSEGICWPQWRPLGSTVFFLGPSPLGGFGMDLAGALGPGDAPICASHPELSVAHAMQG